MLLVGRYYTLSRATRQVAPDEAEQVASDEVAGGVRRRGRWRQTKQSRRMMSWAVRMRRNMLRG